MLPRPDGKHCAACNKTVIDFRNKSDKFIYETFATQSDNICGRYYKHQLNRNIFTEIKINRLVNPKLLLSAGLISGAFFVAGAANSPSIDNIIFQEEKKGNEIPGPIFNKADFVKFIEGKVLYKDYEEVAAAGIIVKVRKSKIKTTTDSNGYFKLVIPDKFLIRDSLIIEFGNKDADFQRVTISTEDLPKYINLYFPEPDDTNEIMGFNTEAYLVGQYEGMVKKKVEIKKKKSLFRWKNK